jgi:hypothetical protein
MNYLVKAIRLILTFLVAVNMGNLIFISIDGHAYPVFTVLLGLGFIITGLMVLTPSICRKTKRMQ